MAILPPVIEVEGEEVTIEAGFLAAKLGLSVDRLRAVTAATPGDAT